MSVVESLVEKKAVFKNTAENKALLVISIHIGYRNSLARFLVDLELLLIIKMKMCKYLKVLVNDE